MRLDDITVIVPTRNEARNIAGFLASLPNEVHLIVVDASNDETPRLVLQLRPDNTLLLPCPGNIAKARQLGAQVAQTNWLLFTDADVIFAEDYFERVQGYSDEGQATGGEVFYGPKLSQAEYADYYQRMAHGMAFMHRIGIPAVSGSNLLIQRKAFWAVDGFDLRLTVNEDSEIGWRLKRHSFRVSFAEDLRVYSIDHRRLQWGARRKTLHTLVRCSLLYLNLMPGRWRSRDWGYWSQPAGRQKHLSQSQPHSS